MFRLRSMTYLGLRLTILFIIDESVIDSQLYQMTKSSQSLRARRDHLKSLILVQAVDINIIYDIIITPDNNR